MPKEYVGSDRMAVDEQGNEVPLNTFRVSVGWNKETGSVQVATVDPDGDPFAVSSGLYVDLDRQGINDLIRHLRRARDQAFGRDE